MKKSEEYRRLYIFYDNNINSLPILPSDETTKDYIFLAEIRDWIWEKYQSALFEEENINEFISS